jgi:cation diffusion facilitator CzcD-associated flavoprotein CzcO
MSERRRLQVVIVGAGIGGIAAAIELKRHGFDDITILEKSPSPGGTWFHNTYPGAACDVPSQLYSFSYEQRRDWPSVCSPQPDILDYLHGVIHKHGLEPLIKTGTEVTACNWSDASARWTVSTADGPSYEADAVIVATGQLHKPAVPRIEGVETFAGHTFHSAQWDHGYDLRGKRVAVVGTGASAVQFVPEVAKEATHLDVFQRTGNWFLPRENRPYPEWFRAIVKYVPGVQAFRRRFWFNYCEVLTAGIRHPKTVGRWLKMRSWLFMRRQLRDSEVRRKAWPNYTFGCKRVLFSSHYLPTLQEPHVDLVTDRIERIAPEGVVTGDGKLHEADCIIWGTGFRTTDFMFPMDVTGREGEDLRLTWAGGAFAHLGMTVPGFPSMFIVYGPNTNTSGGSIILYEEAQVRYIRQALEHVRDTGAAAIEVRGDVAAETDRELQSRFAGTAWTQCDSWYRDEQGRVVTNWPGYMREYVEATSRIDASEYELVPLPDRVAA